MIPDGANARILHSSTAIGNSLLLQSEMIPTLFRVHLWRLCTGASRAGCIEMVLAAFPQSKSVAETRTLHSGAL